jgi:4-hydroxy-3-methylbut-2-en-1-yl diphosphate reductase
MRVIRAEVLGMCFGVRDALQVLQELAEPEVVTIHGQLVHNEAVLSRLRERCFVQVEEADQLLQNRVLRVGLELELDRSPGEELA